MKKISLVFAGFLLASCGPQLVDPSESNGDSDPANGQEFVTVSVGVSESNAGLFNLAAASAFTMSLDGCASGLTYSGISNTNANIDVYKYDQGCLVKLEQFTFDGLTYTPSAGDPFTSWADGDSATFESGGATIKVTVGNQLDNPITGTEAVAYNFSEIVAGADQSIAQSVVSDSHTLSVEGQDAPNFTIAGVAMTGMTASGAGEFTFYLECNVAATNSGATCDGLANADVLYSLVEDTYTGTLTMTEAASIITASSNPISATIAVGNATYPNGGFETVTVTGPAPIHSKPNMLFVIAADNTSYIYFNLDVTTLTYTP